jgi:hypothetical protein
MPNRYIKETICTSETLAALSDAEEVTFYRLLVSCDDYGRFFASPRVLRPRLFPLRMDRVSEDDVAAYIAGLARVGLVTLYTGEDGKEYLYLTNWLEHNSPRSKTSKFPDPSADAHTRMQTQTGADRCAQTQTGARTCMQMRADAPVFGIGSGNVSDNRGSGAESGDSALLLEDVPPPRTPEQDFDEWWKAYPRREDRGKSLSLYLSRRKRKESAAMLLRAAQNYAKAVKESETPPGFVKRATTFLSLTSTYCEECAGEVPTMTDHRGDRRIDLVAERVPNDV